MRKYFRPAAFAFTIAATILTTILRVWLTPQMQDSQTGNFHISYVIIGVMLAFLAIIAVLVLTGKGDLPHTNRMIRHSRMPMAVSGVLFGSVLLITSMFDGWKWMVYDKTPPPNEYVISRLDSITLTFTLLLGIIAGLFFIWLGFKLGSSEINLSPAFALGALAPVLWIWVRLVRYEVSYASAIPVEQSFYDFVMLIFTMLFLFSFARYISKIGDRSPRLLLVYALAAALLSLSGSVASIALFMLGETEAYGSSNLAGMADMSAGVFAICTAFTMIFVHAESGPESLENDPISADSLPDQGEDAGDPEENGNDIPTVDEILRELHRDEGEI